VDEVGGMGILQHNDLSAMHHAKHVYILKLLTSFYQINLCLHRILNVDICIKISADLLLRSQTEPRWIIIQMSNKCSFNVIRATSLRHFDHE